MSRWNLAWLLGIPALVLTGLALVYSAPLHPREHNYKLVRMVVDVLSEIDQHYVRELSDEEFEQLVENMINGGLSRLDPYSTYFNPEEYHSFKTQSDGNFGGIGIQVGYDANRGALRVISPMVGTPAYEAGIMAGDLILKVGDQSTEDMTLSEAVNLIQGEPGTPVTLTVLHVNNNQTEEITVKRAQIEVESVMGYERDPADPAKWRYFVDQANKIAYIRINLFTEQTTEELRQALETIQNAGAHGLILDLRDNPGGLLTTAREVTDLFLTDGRIVSTKNRHGHGTVYEAEAEGTMFLPADTHLIAVLLNDNSASASEIVAAALQDHERAVVVGERSFGKGSVQKVLELSRDEEPAALKLTTDTYWRPSGRNIHRHADDTEEDEWGVKPNPGLEVELTDEEKVEFFLHRRKMDIVQGKPGTTPPKEQKESDEKTEEKPFEDRVLKKAIEYLKEQIKEMGAAPFQNLPAIRGA